MTSRILLSQMLPVLQVAALYQLELLRISQENRFDPQAIVISYTKLQELCALGGCGA